MSKAKTIDRLALKGEEMPYTEEGALKRRLAFWDNTLLKLHQLISDIEVETASNWPKKRDAAVMKQVLTALNLADYEMLMRYREVLGDKLKAMQVGLDPYAG